MYPDEYIKLPALKAKVKAFNSNEKTNISDFSHIRRTGEHGLKTKEHRKHRYKYSESKEEGVKWPKYVTVNLYLSWSQNSARMYVSYYENVRIGQQAGDNPLHYTTSTKETLKLRETL